MSISIFFRFWKNIGSQWKGGGGRGCKYKLHSWKPRNATVKETIFNREAMGGGENGGF